VPPRKSLAVLLFLIVAAVLVAAVIAFAPAPPNDSLSMGELRLAQATALDEQEVARLLPPPYPNYRSNFIQGLPRNAPPYMAGTLLFHADSPNSPWGMSSSGHGTVKTVLHFCADLSAAQYDVSDYLGDLPVIGDWVFDQHAPTDRIVAAVQDILRQSTHHQIVIEKRMLPRPTLIVTGNYDFHSLNRGREPRDIQLFVNTLDPKEGAGGGTEDIHGLLRRIEDITLTRVIDQSANRPAHVVWSNNYDENDCRKTITALKSFLDNLTQQTSLHFEQTTRDFDVYCVREESQPTQPSTP
jgi:hypothetical protein